MRVLIVDDIEDVAVSIQWLLEDTESSWQVRVASDPREALAAAAEFDPDAVIVDLAMPHIDGFEFAERLRRTFADRIALIAYTGFARSPAQRAALAGIDRIVLKPAEVSELVQAVKETVAARRAAA